ncbi:uncharacterized protein LODBEIA_P49030 [Lodderomyces beijingensis]|uniref:Elongator complex protein 6 n=1 Tax=Lodderomyces beijingensis TaxID=1775926 RepID=A0ABP0ZR91_9ASCO
MSGQSQELYFFKNQTLTPDSSRDAPFLTTITYDQSTSASWLVNALVECTLLGTASSVHKELKQPYQKKVVLVSFLHDEQFFIRNCRRNGVDLSRSQSFTFVDYFTDLFEKITDATDPGQVGRLFDFNSVDLANSVVLIEAPEVLLYSTAISSDELLFQLLKVNNRSPHMYLVCAKDSPQFVNYQVSDFLNPAYKITDFLTKLLFRSNMNVTLEPLATGRANDITGSLTVAKGAIPYMGAAIYEREYVYKVTKELNVKVFYR